MKNWPEDPEKCLPAHDLLSPLKKIINDGYELTRQPCMNFLYAGYNIGEEDILCSPTPSERFSSRWLSNEKKFKRYLIDNVLMTAYQLGVEQGRRKERKGKIPYDLLLRMYESRGKKIELLIEKLKAHGEDIDVMENVPITNNDLDVSMIEMFDEHQIPDDSQSGIKVVG